MYGNGAIGGVINVIPRRPNRTGFEHAFRLSAGSNSTFRAAFDTSGPLTNWLAYRLNVSHNRSDGWVDRGESESTAVTGAFAIEVSPNLHLTLSEDDGYQEPVELLDYTFMNGALNSAMRFKNFNVSDARIYYKDGMSQLKVVGGPPTESVSTAT